MLPVICYNQLTHCTSLEDCDINYNGFAESASFAAAHYRIK